MGPVKCAYLVLLVFLSAACLGIPQTHVPVVKGNAAVTKIHAASTAVKGGHIEVVSPSKTAMEDNRLLGGRKMAGSKVKAVDGASTVRSSNQLEGNGGGDQVKWGSRRVECNQQSNTSFSGVDKSGFVAFNEDYHAPRHHPAKEQLTDRSIHLYQI
ncbi:hypothetical protein M0R45_022053 [Rubus argutus]|uniref:Uncharacterized protein n=1 Tax=Rubus argutus TaxID=59490 RepID=A0AAW1XEW0_RUBAR